MLFRRGLTGGATLQIKLDMQTKAREVERKNMLAELADEAEKEELMMKQNIMDRTRKAEGDNLDKLSAERDKRELMQKMKVDMIKKMSQKDD